MNIGIIGTGAFGIALASILNKQNNKVTMWSKFEEEINQLNINRKSPKLNGYTIPDEIIFTNNLEHAIMNKDIIIIAIPANFVSTTVLEMKEYVNFNQHICIASKGIEEKSGKFLFQIVQEILQTNKISIISGPSFAIDIVKKVPVGVTLASNNLDTSKIMKEALETDYFKVSCVHDLIGVSVCGTVKNIIAIGSGIIEGMNLPISTNSLLITTAMHDIRNLIQKLNGNENSVLELAGIGDIILTCTSSKSRNYTFGKLIGESDSQEVIDNYVHNTTIEGLTALKDINKIVDNYQIDTPFIKLMYKIIFENKEKKDLLTFLTK